MSLVVLAHINRAGSTFFSRLLSTHPDIAVSLEAKFPDGLAFKENHFPILKDKLREELEIIWKEPHFNAWNIAQEDVLAQLKDLDQVDFPRFLEVVLSLKYPKAETVVFKNGLYLENLPSFFSTFPKAKLLYIERDPRAIYSSQLRSRSTSNTMMAKNPINVIYQFDHHRRVISAYPNQVFTVNYENLLTDTEKVMRNVSDFLGIDHAKFPEGYKNTGDYEIPEAQKHLHTKIHGSADLSRKDLWKNELSKLDQFFIEFNLKRYLREGKRISFFSIPVGAYVELLRYTMLLRKKRRKKRASNDYTMYVKNHL